MKLDLIFEAFSPTESIIMWLKWFFPPRSKWNPKDLSLWGKALFWWVELQTIGDLGLQVVISFTSKKHEICDRLPSMDFGQNLHSFVQQKINYKENSRGEHLFMRLCEYILRCLSQIFSRPNINWFHCHIFKSWIPIDSGPRLAIRTSVLSHVVQEARRTVVVHVPID